MKKEYKTLIMVEGIIVTMAIASIMFFKSKHVSIIPKCIFKEKYGILCPACNGTSFAREIANLRISNAFMLHPVFFISLVYLGILNISYIYNTITKKNINIFKWWHLIIWIIVLLIYTVLRNIF